MINLASFFTSRYTAICNTWRSKINTCTSRVMIIFIWIMGLVLALPLVIFYEQFDSEYDSQTIPMCHQIWPNYNLQRTYYVVGLFVMCYALPLSFIIVCYFSIVYRVWTRRAPGIASNFATINKSKVKVIKMFAVIVSLFAFSRLPLYAVYFQLHFNTPSNLQYVNFIFDYIVPACQWLGLSNSCVNPIIYCFFSRKYRHGFKSMMRCRICKGHPFQPSFSLVGLFLTKKDDIRDCWSDLGVSAGFLRIVDFRILCLSVNTLLMLIMPSLLDSSKNSCCSIYSNGFKW